MNLLAATSHSSENYGRKMGAKNLGMGALFMLLTFARKSVAVNRSRDRWTNYNEIGFALSTP